VSSERTGGEPTEGGAGVCAKAAAVTTADASSADVIPIDRDMHRMEREAICFLITSSK